MPGKKLIASPLELRKRLLVAESEMNRALLAREYRVLTGDLRSATHHLKKLGGVVSSATALVAVYMAFRSRKSGTEPSRRPWWPACVKLFRLGLPLWIGLNQRKTTVHAAEQNGEQNGD